MGAESDGKEGREAVSVDSFHRRFACDVEERAGQRARPGLFESDFLLLTPRDTVSYQLYLIITFFS